MYYKDVTNCSNLCWNFDENYRLNKPIDNSSLYNIAIMLRKTKVKKRKKQLLCRTHSGTTLNYQHKHKLSTHLSCQQSIQHSLAYDLSSKYDLKQRKYVDLQIDNKNYDDDKQCQMMNKCVAIKKHFPLPKWNDEMVDPNNNNENDEENNDIKQYLGLLNLQSNLNNERGKDQDKTTIATRTLSIECNTTNDSSNVCNQLPLPKELFNHDQLSFTSSSSSSSSSSSLCYGVKEWRSYRPKMNYSSDSSSTSSSSTLIVQCLLLVLITLISSNSFRSMALPVFAVANPLLSDAVNSLPLPYITFNDSGIIVDRRHRHSTTTTRPISTWLSIIDERNQRPESNSIIRFETIGTRSYHNNGFTTHSNELQSSEIDQDDNIQTNYSAKRIMPSYTVDDRYQWICFDSINRYPTIDNETQWTLNKLFQLNSNIWSMKSFKNLNQTQPTIKLCVRRATNYDLSHLNKNGKVAINVDDQQNVRIKKKLKRQQQQLPKRRDDRTTTNLISNDRTVQMATSTIHNNNNFVTTMARNDKRLCQTYVDDDDDNDDENEHWATSEKSSECATDEAIRIGMGIESLLYIVRNKLYQMRHKMMPYPKENKMKWDDRNKGKQFDTKMDSDFGVRCRSCRSSHSCQTERKRNDRMTMTMPMIMMNESASSDNGQNRQKTTTMTTISTINEHKPNSTKHSILIEQKLKMLTNDGTRSSESSKTDSGIRINTFESGDAANNVKLTTIVDRLRQETMNNYNVNGKLNASDTDLFHHHHKLGKSGKNVHNQNQTIENQIDDHKVVQSITLNSLIIYVDVNQEEMKETNDLPHNETNQLIVRVRSVTNNSIKISDLQWEVCHFQLSSASNVSSSIVKCHTIVGKHLLTILNDLDRELCWLERFQRNETDHIVETSLHSMKTMDEHFSSTTKLDDNTQNRNCNNDLWPSYNLTRSNNNTRTNNNSLIRWWHKLTRKQTVEMDRQQTPIPVGNNGNDIGHNRNPVNHRYAENLRTKVRAQIMVTTPNVSNVVKTPILVHHDTTPTQWNKNGLLYGLNNDETKPTTIATTKMTTTKSTKIFYSNNENVWNMIPNQNDKTNADEVSKPKTNEIGLKWPLKTMDDRMYHNWPIENDDQLKKRVAVKMNEDDAQVMLDLLPSSILSTPPPPPSSSSSATHNRDGRRRRLMSISFNDADSIDDEGGHHIDINSNNSNNNIKNGKQANAVKLESTGYNRNLVITNISDKSNQSILHNRATINRLNTEQKPTMMTIDANVFQQIENEKDSNWTIIKHHDIGNDENATTTTGNRIITTTTSTTTTTTTTTISNNNNDQISTKLLKRVKQVRATFQFDKSNNTNRLPSNSIQLQSSLNIEQDQMLLKSNSSPSSSSSSSSVQLPQDILALHWKSCSTLNGTNCTNAIESSQTELSQSLSPTSTTIDWLSSNTIITDVSVNNRTTPISVLKVETSTNSQHDQTNLGLNNLMPQPITTTTASTISRFMFEPTNNVKRKTTTVTLPINVTSNLDRIELLSVNKNVTTIETGTKWINGIHSTNGSSSSSSSSTAIPARIMEHVQNETLLSNIAVDISVINDELNANNRLNDHIDASNITINRSNNHINNDGILMPKMPVNVNDRIDLMENGDKKIRFPNSTTTTTTLFTNSTLLQSTNVNVLNELSYENDDDIDRININNHNKNDCPPNHESNDGIHLWWTRTDSGVLAVQPCQPIALYSGTIFRPCYTSGEWGYTDWSECRLKPLREIHRLVLQHVQKHLLDGLVPLAIQLKRLLLPMVIVLNGTNTNVSTITNQRTTKTTTTNTSSSNSSTTVAVASLLHSPLDRIDALSSLNAILLNSKIRIRIDHDVDDERRTIQFVQTLILISQHLLVETKSIQFLDDDVTQEQNAILIGHLVETFNSFRLMVENLLRSLILSCQDGSIDLLQRQTEPLLPPMLDHIEITLSHRDSASNQMVTLISSKMSHHNGGPHKVVDANETMIMNHDNRRKRTKRTSLMVKHDRRYEARLLWTTLRQYQPKLSINFEDFSKMGVGVAEIWFHDMGNSLDYGNNRLLSDLLLVSIVPAVSIEVDFEHSPQFELIFPLYEFKLNIQSTMANKNDDIVMNDTNDSNERHRQPFINDNNDDDDDDNMSNDEAIELIHDYGWSRNKKNLNSDEDDEDEYNFETNDDGNDEIGKTKIGCGRLLPNVHQTSIWTSNGCTSLSINRTHLRCRCMKPGIFGAITFPLISSTIDEAFGGGMSVENQNMHIERPNDSKPLNTNRSTIELNYVHNRNHIHNHNHHHHFESHFRTRLSNYDLSLYFSFIFGIIFLLITLIIQYRLRQYETRETYFIVRNLCITLFLIQFTFLFGTTFHMDAFWIRIAQLSSQTIQTEFFHRVKHAICLAVPVFLHFIHLVTLFWMLSHTIMLYQRFWKPTSSFMEANDHQKLNETIKSLNQKVKSNCEKTKVNLDTSQLSFASAECRRRYLKQAKFKNRYSQRQQHSSLFRMVDCVWSILFNPFVKITDSIKIGKRLITTKTNFTPNVPMQMESIGRSSFDTIQNEMNPISRDEITDNIQPEQLQQQQQQQQQKRQQSSPLYSYSLCQSFACQTPLGDFNWKCQHYLTLSMAIPFLLVLASYLLNPRGYETRRYCWMSIEGGIQYSFIIPVLVLITTNTLLMLWVLKRYFERKPMTHRIHLVQIRPSLRASITLLPFFSLNWFLSVLSLETLQTTPFELIFAITNCLHSFMVFYFHCYQRYNIHYYMKARYSRLHLRRRFAKMFNRLLSTINLWLCPNRSNGSNLSQSSSFNWSSEFGPSSINPNVSNVSHHHIHQPHYHHHQHNSPLEDTLKCIEKNVNHVNVDNSYNLQTIKQTISTLSTLSTSSSSTLQSESKDAPIESTQNSCFCNHCVELNYDTNLMVEQQHNHHYHHHHSSLWNCNCANNEQRNMSVNGGSIKSDPCYQAPQFIDYQFHSNVQYVDVHNHPPLSNENGNNRTSFGLTMNENDYLVEKSRSMLFKMSNERVTFIGADGDDEDEEVVIVELDDDDDDELIDDNSECDEVIESDDVLEDEIDIDDIEATNLNLDAYLRKNY